MRGGVICQPTLRDASHAIHTPCSAQIHTFDASCRAAAQMPSLCHLSPLPNYASHTFHTHLECSPDAELHPGSTPPRRFPLFHLGGHPYRQLAVHCCTLFLNQGPQIPERDVAGRAAGLGLAGSQQYKRYNQPGRVWGRRGRGSLWSPTITHLHTCSHLVSRATLWHSPVTRSGGSSPSTWPYRHEGESIQCKRRKSNPSDVLRSTASAAVLSAPPRTTLLPPLTTTSVAVEPRVPLHLPLS